MIESTDVLLIKCMTILLMFYVKKQVTVMQRNLFVVRNQSLAEIGI